MSVLRSRVAAAVVVLVFAVPSALLAQGASRSGRSPPKSTGPAVGRATARQLLDRVRDDLLAERTVDEAVAAQMLGLNCREVSLADTRVAHQLYCGAIVAPALRAAVESVDTKAQKLVDLLDRNETLLKKERVPEDLIAAQRIYLAQYQFGLPDRTPLRTTLDSVGDSMTIELVWPGLPGMYWNLRGLLAGDDANYALALDCHSRALTIRQDAGLAEDRAESLNNLGYLLFRMGDHAAAKSVLSDACSGYAAFRAAKKSEPTPGELLARMNLAKANEASQEFDAALEQFQSLMAVAKNYPEPLRTRFDFQFRNHAAITHYSLGDFAACERELKICRAAAAKELGEQALHVAEIDINLGWVALATGRAEIADRQFESAINNLRAHHRAHHRYAEGLGYLARAKAEVGAVAEARKLLDEALRLREQQLDVTLASALSERDRLAYVQQLRVHPESLSWPGALDTYLELASKLSISAADQYERVLKWKGALDRHNPGQAARPADDEARAIEAERAVTRMQLLGLAAAARRKEPQALAEVAQLERDANRLERKLRAARGAAPLAAKAVGLAEVVAAIPAGAALIDLIEVRRYQPRTEGERVGNDRRYIGFVIDSSGDVRRIDLEKSVRIDSPAVLFRERIETRGAFEGPARQINELVGRTFRRELGNATQLIISPDGALQHIPWAALPGLEKKYWVEELTITTVPSAVALVTGRKHTDQPQRNSWLVVGGVDYGTNPSAKNKWVPLNQTQAEAVGVDRRLAAAFITSAQSVTLVTGQEASKERVKELLAQRRCVHLATHGEFQKRRTDSFSAQDALAPLDSVLVFAGANIDPTGGAQSLLTAEELASLDLSGVDLMVLSACQTGLGHVQAGQGQVGLVGALSTAGVGTVVASLWKVDDAATARLMERFYAHALKPADRISVSAALRQAQLDLLAEPMGQHPYLWAAWGVTGQPDCVLGP